MSTTDEQLVDAPPVSKLNAKQQSRIQKRRLARQQLMTHLALVRKNNKTHNISPSHAGEATKSAGCIRSPLEPEASFPTPEQVTIDAIGSLTIHETKATVMENGNKKPKL